MDDSISMISEQTPEEAPISNTSMVIKNTGIYVIGSLLSWLFILAHIIIAPRYFGPTVWGQYNIGWAAATLLTSQLGFCIENYLVVSIGKKRERAESMLRATVGLRLAMMPLMIALGAAGIYVSRLNHDTTLFAMIGLTSICFTFVFSPFTSVLLGWEEAKKMTVISVLTSFTTIVPIIVYRYGPLPTYIFHMFLYTFAPIAFQIWYVSRRINVIPQYDPKLWKELIFGGAPFLVNSIILLMYATPVIYMLRHFSTDAMVGSNAILGRLMGVIMFFPSAVAQALLPTAVRVVELKGDRFKAVQTRIMMSVIVVGAYMSIIFLILSKPIVMLLYGAKYPDLPLQLQFSAAMIIPLYLTTTLYTFLVAMNKNKIWSFFLLGTVIINSAAAWFLIPACKSYLHNAGVGAVLATTIAESMTAIFALVLLKSPIFAGKNLVAFLKLAFSCLVMGLCVWAARDLFLLIPLVLGSLVFTLCVWKTKTLSDEDQGLIRVFIMNKTNRLKAIFSR